jgi:hypothetical protein
MPDASVTDPVVDEAELAAKAAAVCRMGSLMLTAGTGSYRVKAAMGRVALALGVDRLDAQVSLNEVVVTTRIGSSFRTQVVEVPVPVVNADRINRLLRVSLTAQAGITADQLNAQLDEVTHRGRLYPSGVVVLGAVGACAAFAVLSNGRWQEALAAGGLDAPAAYLIRSTFRLDGGRAAMARLLDLPEPPDAVVAGNNLMGVGALQILTERKLYPPQVGVAVVGSLPFTTFSPTGITFAHLPARRMGLTAARLLMARIGGDKQPSRTVVLPYRLEPAADGA